MNKDSLLFNKVAAGVVAAGLIAMSLGVLSDILYNPEKLAQNSYTISEGAPASAGAAPADMPEIVMISDMLATADAAKGEKLLKKCVACHSFDQGGANKLGPNLYDIVGRDIGGHAGYGYSAAMAAYPGVWGYEELSQFLTKPKNFINGTKMQFAGLKKPSDRANLVAYLRRLSANPAPLP